MPVGTGEENREEFGAGGVLGDTFVRIFVDVHETCGTRGGMRKFTCTAARCGGLGGRGRWVRLRGDPSLRCKGAGIDCVRAPRVCCGWRSKTCWLRQHAPRRRREARLVVGVGLRCRFANAVREVVGCTIHGSRAGVGAYYPGFAEPHPGLTTSAALRRKAG